MGMFDWVRVNDPRFVCSEGHYLGDEQFQTKDLGETMGAAVIEANGEINFTSHGWGEPYIDPLETDIEVYCDCRQCPAFVQYGTGNLMATGCNFLVKTDGTKVISIERTSEPTAEFLKETPFKSYMVDCEGPMPYEQARERHTHYPQEIRDAFRAKWREEHGLK